MNSNNQAGGQPDLLSAIYGIKVDHNQKISEEDRAFCQQEQDKMNKVLDQLQEWHLLLKVKAEDPAYQSLRAEWKEDGSVDFTTPLYRYPNSEGNYSIFEFYPFECINRIVKLCRDCYYTFGRTVIAYFNATYNLNVPQPTLGEDKNKWGFRPQYNYYVNHVIDHLGGKTFRQTAEDEVLERFLAVVQPWGFDKTKPEIKGATISFPRGVRLKENHWDRDDRISWSHLADFNRFIAGIMFGAMNILNGSVDHIQNFDNDNVDFSVWYNLTVNGAVTMKLYKNGRVDIKFRDKESAQKFFYKLKLDSLKLPER